jgi:hypothetical protein
MSGRDSNVPFGMVFILLRRQALFWYDFQIHFYMLELCITEHAVNPSSSPYKRPRRPRGGVEVQHYSVLNLGARCGWVVNAMPQLL